MEPPDQAPRGNRKPAGPSRAVAVLRTLTLFGFVQLDFAGTFALADGRYVLREGDEETVLVVNTLAAPAPPRRRRRARAAEAPAEPATLPLSRVTVVRASAPFEDEVAARSWLEGALDSEGSIEAALDEATRPLEHALHAQAAASGIAQHQTASSERATVARLGYGSGEEVAEGTFTKALEIDPRVAGSRRRRAEELRPQERVAAVLSGRERIDACETLVPRARADLDAGRDREAALQLRIGLEALLIELRGALNDPDHEEDMATLESRLSEVGKVAAAALRGDLDAAQLETVQDLTAICERVLRRRRVLRG